MTKKELAILEKNAIAFEKERAENLAHLQHKERVLHTLMECLSAGVIIHENATVIDCNEAFAEMRQKSQEDVIGEHGFDMIPEEDHDQISKVVMCSDIDVRHSYETSIIGAKGRITRVTITSQTVRLNGTTCRVAVLTPLGEIVGK